MPDADPNDQLRRLVDSATVRINNGSEIPVASLASAARKIVSKRMSAQSAP